MIGLLSGRDLILVMIGGIGHLNKVASLEICRLSRRIARFVVVGHCIDSGPRQVRTALFFDSIT